MNRKFMETLSIVLLFSCIVIIAVREWRCFRSKKKRNAQNPNNLIVDDENNDITRKDKDDLKHTYDTVNAWLSNCDQKASILLAVVGVVITVLVTSDFLKGLRSIIFGPFVKYWTEETELGFLWSRFTVFVLIVIAAGMLITSCYYLFKTIWANIDYDKMREENPDLVEKSFIFWGTVSAMSYDDFKRENVNYVDDLKSQIYVNSKIAMAKFKNYNEGLHWFKSLLLVSVMLFVAIMFVR